VAGEESLGPEAIAVSLRLKLVLDEEEVTVERIPGSEGDREGRRWPVMVSRGGRPRAELRRVRHACEGRKKGGGAPAVPTCEYRAATAQGRRRPMMIGAGALYAMSTITAC
jgi:hypothetical protein